MTVVSRPATSRSPAVSSAHAATVLVVDDEPEVRTVLRGFLELSGFRVLEADDSAALYNTLENHTVDLVTLDIHLGGENGLDIARILREHFTCGIIIVSGQGDMVDRVVGLEIGADDYITKPFELRELLARVRSVLRRTVDTSALVASAPPVVEASETLTFEGYTLTPSRRQLHDAEGQLCELTSAEYNLLELFVRSPNQVLSRDQIMDHLRGHDWAPNDRSIDNGVARLRRKLTGCNSQGLIKTIRGAGYLFAATVQRG